MCGTTELARYPLESVALMTQGQWNTWRNQARAVLRLFGPRQP